MYERLFCLLHFTIRLIIWKRNWLDKPIVELFPNACLIVSQYNIIWHIENNISKTQKLQYFSIILSILINISGAIPKSPASVWRLNSHAALLAIWKRRSGEGTENNGNPNRFRWKNEFAVYRSSTLTTRIRRLISLRSTNGEDSNVFQVTRRETVATASAYERKVLNDR